MQGYTACQPKPDLFRPGPSQFPAVTAAFPEGGGAIFFILLYRGNPVKFTDPDGRADGDVIGPGEWDQPGNQPTSYYIGNTIHKAITAQYNAAHGNDTVYTNSTPVSTIAGTGHEGSGRLRPDIYNASTGDLYEIKSSNDAASAASDLSSKLIALKAAGLSAQPGNSLDAGTYGVVPAPGGYAEYMSPAPGVIIYSYHRGSTVEKPAPNYMPAINSKPQTNTNMYGLAGLSTSAIILYLVISEGSRIFIPRNLVPIW
jgi:hypothetical protein